MPAKREFVPDDVWRLRAPSDPHLCPDGTRVAYVVGAPDAETDKVASTIWIATTDGSVPPRRFTSGPTDTGPRWSPDGRWLAFLSERGDEAQLFVAPLDGGEPRSLTAAPFGVSAPAWSPDSTHLAYVARTGEWKKPEERSALERSAPRVVTGLYNRFDSLGWFDERRSHVFVVDVDDGRARQLTDGDWDDDAPAWSPDGSLLAFTSDRSASRADVAMRDVWVTALGNRRRPRRLTRCLGTAAAPQFSPDGTTIAFVGHEAGSGNTAVNTQLLVVPVDGSEPPRSLSGALDRTVWGLRPIGGSHAWTADGKGVLFAANDRGTQGIYRAGTTGRAPELVVGGDRQIVALHAAAGVVAFAATWPSAPAEISCVAADGTAERQISKANAELRAAVRFAPVRRRTHVAADGRRIDSYVLYPPGRSKGAAAPLVLEIHGGPHGSHPQASMLALYQSLAAAGYVVVLPNPRGSHGYGEEFAGACVGDWGGADFDDLMGAVDDLVRRGVADPERLYVAGYSFGGFMTSWTIGHTDRFRAACVSAPVINLSSMFGTTDIPFFSEHEAGGLPWEQPEAYARHSPISYLPEITTPVQLLHWEGDLRCPIGQADELFQGLKKLGREVVFVRYPGGFHVARTPSQMADFVARHIDWFAAHQPGGRRR